MKFKPRYLLASTAVIAVLGSAAWYGMQGQGMGIAPAPEAEVEMTAIVDGAAYKLYQGDFYRVNPRSGKWDFVKRGYDPDFYAKNYLERDGLIFRTSDDGELIPVRKQFADDFEGAGRLADLIGLQRGWTSCSLQSPLAPKVNDYVKLRNGILRGESDFLDNRIEPDGTVVHGGKTSLKTVSVPPGRGMVTAKASLSTELLHFVKGDDVSMSIWCHVPEGSGMPFTVLDLETTWMTGHPGMRIVISGGQYAAFQLKGFGDDFHRQPKGKEVPFPKGRWVHLKAHLTLSEKEDGVIELWQDGQKIIDSRGRTLPLAHTIYNSFEIGVSAYNGRGKSVTLFLDDVSVSDRPMMTSTPVP